MVAHGVTVPREDDCFRVIKQPLPRDTTEVHRGADERAAKGLDREIKDELGPHRARIREHHDEDPECTRSAHHGERTDVSPVDLSLLPDEALDPEIDLTARDGSHVGHVTSQDGDTALVTA